MIRRRCSPPLASLGALAGEIEVIFYGQDLRGVEALSARYKISERVHVRPPIPHSESLEQQQLADVLLLLLWSDPSESGIYTGKLFDNIGAERQILAIGAPDGMAAQLIRSRGLGVVACEPETIAVALRRWIEEKRASGRVAGPPSEAKIGLTRDEQFEKANNLLLDLHGSSR